MSKKNNIACCGAVIVAGGSGRRMKLDKKNADVNKVFLQLGDMPVLAHTLRAFECCDVIDKIVIVTRERDIPLCVQLAEEFKISKLQSVVCGGDTRQKSVQNGLREMEDVCEFVAIHDGARCLIEPYDIENVVLAAKEYGAAALGIPCTDTLIKVDENSDVTGFINREGAYRVQTPQVFLTKDIICAHKKAAHDGISVTDDCSAAIYAGVKIKMVEGSALNIKLTTQEDLELMSALLKEI